MVDTNSFSDASLKIDVIYENDEHKYYSTWCRHGNHDACQSLEIYPGVPRNPSQCKTCASPCICICHKNGSESEA